MSKTVAARRWLAACADLGHRPAACRQRDGTYHVMVDVTKLPAPMVNALSDPGVFAEIVTQLRARGDIAVARAGRPPIRIT